MSGSLALKLEKPFSHKVIVIDKFTCLTHLPIKKSS